MKIVPHILYGVQCQAQNTDEPSVAHQKEGDLHQEEETQQGRQDLRE